MMFQTVIRGGFVLLTKQLVCGGAAPQNRNAILVGVPTRRISFGDGAASHLLQKLENAGNQLLTKKERVFRPVLFMQVLL